MIKCDAYLCDFCDKYNTDINKMLSHENKCNFNPVNKKCYTCRNSQWRPGMRKNHGCIFKPNDKNICKQWRPKP